jgi:hypothetical protein
MVLEAAVVPATPVHKRIEPPSAPVPSIPTVRVTVQMALTGGHPIAVPHEKLVSSEAGFVMNGVPTLHEADQTTVSVHPASVARGAFAWRNASSGVWSSAGDTERLVMLGHSGGGPLTTKTAASPIVPSSVGTLLSTTTAPASLSELSAARVASSVPESDLRAIPGAPFSATTSESTRPEHAQTQTAARVEPQTTAMRAADMATRTCRATRAGSSQILMRISDVTLV